MITKEVKRRLWKSKGNWLDELQLVIWSYRTTTRTLTKETPFSLLYGTEAVIHVEVNMRTTRTSIIDVEANEIGLRVSSILLEEWRYETNTLAQLIELKSRSSTSLTIRVFSWDPFPVNSWLVVLYFRYKVLGFFDPIRSGTFIEIENTKIHHVVSSMGPCNKWSLVTIWSSTPIRLQECKL